MKWLAVALVFSCTAPVRRPSTSDVVLTGSTAFGGFERRAEPMSSVSVRLTQSDATAQTTSNAAGTYRLSLRAPDTVSTSIVTAWKSGFAPVARAVRVGPSTEFAFSFVLEPLPALDCIDTFCTDALGDVRWLDVPAGAEGKALLLDGSRRPTLPAANELLTAVAIEPSTPAGSLRLRIPIERWASIIDTQTGTTAIEVESQTLGPDDRNWVMGPRATLETELGEVISEDALDSIRTGAFLPGVTARVTLTRAGVIGLFGGAVTTGCIEGSVTLDGAPAEGLVLLPHEGVPAAASASGAVCFEANVGQDARVARPHYAGVSYGSVSVPAPTVAGRCGSSTCRALGKLALRSDVVAAPAPCQVKVNAVDEVAQPVPGALIIGNDDSLTQAAFSTICGAQGSRCTLTAATDMAGAATLVVPSSNGIELEAKVTTTLGQRRGWLTLPGCPREPVTLRLLRGRVSLEASATFIESDLDWAPAHRATKVVVERQGRVVFELRSPVGLTPPLQYGEVPPHSVSTTQATTAAQSGDVLRVVFDGVDATGIVVTGAASATRSP